MCCTVARMASGIEIPGRAGLAWLSVRSLHADRALAHRIGIGLLLLVGFWLRCRGVLWDVVALDLDEASWARRLLTKPLTELLIRPPGYMALTKLVVELFGPWEFALRSLSWFSGLLVLFTAPGLARTLLASPAARLLFVAVIALHPAAIDLSKEFKPYAASLAVHWGLLYFVATYRQTRSRRALLGALALLPLGVLFAQDAVFAYPGVVLVLAAVAYQARDRRHLAQIGASVAATFATLGALYFLIWNRLEVGSGGSETQFWGVKYGVFYSPGRVEGQTFWDWLFERWTGMMAFPGHRRRIWNDTGWEAPAEVLRTIDFWLWVGLFVAGVLVLLYRRNAKKALLLILPLLVMTAANLVGVWPLGAFRTNVFLLVYTALVAAVAVDQLGRRLRSAGAAFVPALGLVVAPFVAFETTWHANKRVFSESSALPQAMHEVLTLQGGKSRSRELLILDSRGCSAFKFYTRYHPGFKRSLPRDFSRRLRPSCTEISPSRLRRVVQEESGENRRVWMILGWSRSFEKYADEVPSGVRLVHRVPITMGGSLTNLVLGLEAE